MKDVKYENGKLYILIGNNDALHNNMSGIMSTHHESITVREETGESSITRFLFNKTNPNPVYIVGNVTSAHIQDNEVDTRSKLGEVANHMKNIAFTSDIPAVLTIEDNSDTFDDVDISTYILAIDTCDTGTFISDDSSKVFKTRA